MKQTLQPGLLIALAAFASSSLSAQFTHVGREPQLSGSLSGIVRDVDGVPQMGALVQAILPDTGLSASAVTDSRGHYHIALPPGSYRVSATAALLLPAVREHLQIARGTRAVVDLTLSTLLAPTGWLPASRRNVNEPSDDWMWTLRSSAGRSILRLANEHGANAPADGTLAVSSSTRESRRGIAGGRLTFKDSDGGFARGGSHNTLVLTRVNEDGSGTVLRADLSGSRSPYPVAPSAEISVGFQRRTPLNGFSRAVFTYSAHPELADGRGARGMQGATLRSAQRIELGDLLRIDAGSVMRDSNLGGNALVVEPFLRVAAHIGDNAVIAYGFTRARGTESLDDLDRVQAATPIAIVRDGHLQLEGGSHQAVSLQSELPGKGSAELAVYRDRLRNPLIAGTGTFSQAELQVLGGVIADPTTRTYRVAAQDYSSSGVRLTFRQPVTRSLHAGAELTTGDALWAAGVRKVSLNSLLHQLQPTRTYAATAFADGRILRTGTTVRASYRWQPQRTLTAIDAFRIGDDGAYLSCSMRQSLSRMRFVPQGLEAVLDLQNLLSEGYQPFLSNDGQTLYLAQTPRTLQAGLSFSF